jgi:hypothetical protein
MSTRLYEQYVMGDTSEHGDLNRRVWAGTPWIIDAYTGRDSLGDNRANDMLWWLTEEMGEQAWPFGPNPRPGRWYRGSATINGWTWFGFATEADMQTFLARWPAPEGERSPPAPAARDIGGDEKL